MNFEDELGLQLRRALAREQAPADFKRKLTARVENLRGADSRVVRILWWRQRRYSLALAALVAAIAIPGVVSEHRRMERQRGIEARNQLITALSVTNATLRHTRQMIRNTARRAS